MYIVYTINRVFLIVSHLENELFLLLLEVLVGMLVVLLGTLLAKLGWLPGDMKLGKFWGKELR